MSEELVRQSSTLFQITDDLQCYYETLESIEAALSIPPPDDEREELEHNRSVMLANIERIGADLVTKTDNIAGVLRRIEAESVFLKAERARLSARQKAFERADEWLRRYVLSVMQQRGITQIKSPSNTLFIRASDGVKITNQEELPDVYQTAEVKVPLAVWKALLGLAAGVGSMGMTEALAAVRVKAEPSLSAIKKAIKGGETVTGADLEFRDNLVVR